MTNSEVIQTQFSEIARVSKAISKRPIVDNRDIEAVKGILSLIRANCDAIEARIKR